MKWFCMFTLALGTFCQSTSEGVIKEIEIQTVHGEVKLCVTVDVSGVQPPTGGVILGHVNISANSEVVFESEVIIEPIPTTQTLCFSLPVECMAHDVGGASVKFFVSLDLQGGGGTVTGSSSRTTIIDAGPISPIGVMDFFAKKIDLILSQNQFLQPVVDALTDLKNFATDTVAKANGTPSLAGFNVLDWYENRLKAMDGKLATPVLQVIQSKDMITLKRLNDCQMKMIDMIPRFVALTDTISNGRREVDVPVGFSAIGTVLLTKKDGTVIPLNSFPAFAKPILASATADTRAIAQVLDPTDLKFDFDCTDEGKTSLTYTVAISANMQADFAFRFQNTVLMQQKPSFPCDKIELTLKIHEEKITLDSIDELRNVTGDNFSKIADELADKLKKLAEDCKPKNPKNAAAAFLVQAKQDNAVALTTSYITALNVDIEKCTMTMTVCMLMILGSKPLEITVPHEEGHIIIKKKVYRDEMASAVQKIAKCLYEHAGLEPAKGDAEDAVVFLGSLQLRINDEYESKTDSGNKFPGKNKEMAESVPDNIDDKFAECLCEELEKKTEDLKKMGGQKLREEIKKMADECSNKLATDIRKDWDEKFK